MRLGFRRSSCSARQICSPKRISIGLFVYIQKHLQHEFGLEIGVHPVSSLPDRLSLLDRFFERELLPEIRSGA